MRHDDEEATTPGSYVLALYCNIGSSFHVPGIGQPPTTPAEADLTKPFTVDAAIDTAGAMTSVAPARLMDTRSGNGAVGPVAAKATAERVTEVVGIGIDTDILYPATEVRAWVEAYRPHVAARYEEITSVCGHDAFLIEFDQVTRILAPDERPS